MRIVLHGHSSLSLWLTANTCTPFKNRRGVRVLIDCEPTPEAVRYLELAFPRIPQPYHVSVLKRNKKRFPKVVSHESIYRHSNRVYCQVGSGIYASCPELCLAQTSGSLSFPELLLASNVLCGAFFKRATDGSLMQRRPLTDKGKILTFLQNNPGIHGSKQLREATRWITAGTASPPEAVLSMMLGLPYRLGGFQLKGFALNRRITPSLQAQSVASRATLVPDILFQGEKLVLEYDSTAEHTSARQLALDAKKRLALELDGYKVITVTARQMQNAGEMRKIAEQIYRHLGLRFRPRSEVFEQKQHELLGVGRMLDRYFVNDELDNSEQLWTDFTSAIPLLRGENDSLDRENVRKRVGLA